MALIQQEERVSVLKELREELIDYKNEFESYSNYESFDESFRALDPDCQNIQLISSYDLYVSTVLPLEHKGIRSAMVGWTPPHLLFPLPPLDYYLFVFFHSWVTVGHEFLCLDFAVDYV